MFGISQVTLGAGEAVREAGQLSLSAQEAVRSERAKASLGGNRVIEASRVHFSEQTGLLSLDRKRNLDSLLESMNTSRLRDWFSDLERSIDHIPPVQAEELFTLQDRILESVRVHALRHDASEFFPMIQDQTQEDCGQACGIDGFIHALERGLLQYLERLQEKLSSQEKLPIRLAKAYIQEHFREPITLESVAEKAGLSPAYFSTSFRKMENRTFTEYLTYVRLEAAKDLLATTRKTIYEIALEVGYVDDKYFTKVFKKETGIRPGEYRKLYYRGDRR